MVDLDVIRVEETLNGDVLLRVGAFFVLLAPQPVFDKVLPGRVGFSVFSPDALHYPLVFRAAGVHLPLELVSLAEVLCHLARELDIDEGRAAPALADNGVEHLDRLRYRAAHDGARHVLKVLLRRMEQTSALRAAVSFEVVSRRLAGVVVFHALLEDGDELAAGLDGDVPETAEAQRFQRVHVRGGQPRGLKKRPDLRGSLEYRERPADLVALVEGQLGKAAFRHGVEGFFHLMIAFEIAEFRLFLCFLDGNAVPIGHDIECCSVGHAEMLSYLREVHIGALVRESGQLSALLIGQRRAVSVRHEPDMIDVLQKREVFKGIRRLCGTGFVRLQRAAAYHALDLAARVGAALAGAFVKGTLAQKNIEVRSFKFFRGKCRAKTPLRGEQLMHLVLDHVPADRRDILAALVALALGVCRVAVQHLGNCAVALFGHQRLVRADGCQKLAVFFRGTAFSVRSEAAPLGYMEQDARKLPRRNGTVKRADTKRIYVFKLAVKERRKIFGGHDPALDKQPPNTLVPVAVTTQAAAHAPLFPPRRGERLSRFRLLCGVEDARAHVDYSERPVVAVERHFGPANRGYSYIQTYRIRPH